MMQQSSAAPGSQDIIITYNDGNANPTLGASGGSNEPEPQPEPQPDTQQGPRYRPD